MILLIIFALSTGAVFGYNVLSADNKPLLDTILLQALNVMVFVGGMGIGSNKNLVKKMLKPKIISLILAVPLAVITGSLLGGVIFGHILGISIKDSLLVAGGLGWYSFSSVIISAMYSTEVGTMAFLTNVLREILSFILIPLAARFTDLPCVSIGGASTMDSTLPVVLKYTNSKIAVIGFINGLVLSLAVPLLMSFLLSL